MKIRKLMKRISCTVCFISLLCTTNPISYAQSADYIKPVESRYYVRFVNNKLPVYDLSQSAQSVIGYLHNGDKVEVLGGPIDTFIKVKQVNSDITGYIEFRYLKQENAIVEDSDIYTYDEMVEDMVSLVQKYPQLLKINQCGTSLDNRIIYDLTLGNPNASKNIIIHAGIHGREHTNPYLVMEQLEMALNFFYSGIFNGTNYHDLFSKVAVHIVPMVNPDGISISQLGENGIRDESLKQILRECYKADRASRLTKKSYSEYLKRWKANARGVDPNRNFPTNFNKKVTVSHPAYGFYNGTSALSEPESIALANLTLQYKPNAVISYHSTGQILYWTSDVNKSVAASQKFTNVIAGLTGYKKMPACQSNGGYLEWVQSFDYPVMTTTIETGATECPLTFASYPGIWKQNYLILLSIADYIKNS